MKTLLITMACIVFCIPANAGPPWNFKVLPDSKQLKVTVSTKNSSDNETIRVLVVIPRDQTSLKNKKRPIARLNVRDKDRVIFAAHLGESSLDSDNLRYIFTIPMKHIDSATVVLSPDISWLIKYHIQLSDFIHKVKPEKIGPTSRCIRPLTALDSQLGVTH